MQEIRPCIINTRSIIKIGLFVFRKLAWEQTAGIDRLKLGDETKQKPFAKRVLFFL